MKHLRLFVVGVAGVLVLAWPVLGDGGAAAPPAAPVAAPHVTAQEVDGAIAHGCAYLFSTEQKETGRFGEADPKVWIYTFTGGHDVVALTALAYAHETGKPEFQKGLAALRELELDCTYCLGLRLILYAELYRQADRKHDAAQKTGIR